MARPGAQFGPDISFLGVPRADLADPGSFADADVVILGAPLDWGASHRAGARFGPKAIREADLDEFGHPRLGGIGAWLEREVEEETGYEARMVVLGHVQRGGTPTAYDRILATRYGVGAIDAWDRGERGMMVALRGTEIVTVPLSEALAAPKLLDPELYRTAEVFCG